MTTNAPTPTGSGLDGTDPPGDAPPGLVNRYSPAVQVAIVAAAIIPTVVFYIGYRLIRIPENPYQDVAELAAFCFLYGSYFVGVIWLVNKYPLRRKWVLTAAILTVALDTVVSCFIDLPNVHLAATLANVAYAGITVAYVAVWGIARRQSDGWMFGLPFAAIVAGAAQFGLWQHPGRSYWWEPWTGFVGSIVIGCLLCWAFDLLGRRAKNRREAPSS